MNTYRPKLHHVWRRPFSPLKPRFRSFHPSSPVLKCFSFRHQQLKFIHGKPALDTRSFVEVVNCWVNGVLGVGCWQTYTGKHTSEIQFFHRNFRDKFNYQQPPVHQLIAPNKKWKATGDRIWVEGRFLRGSPNIHPSCFIQMPHKVLRIQTPSDFV